MHILLVAEIFHFWKALITLYGLEFGKFEKANELQFTNEQLWTFFLNRDLNLNFSLFGRLLDLNLIDFVPRVGVLTVQEGQSARKGGKPLHSILFLQNYRFDLIDRYWFQTAFFENWILKTTNTTFVPETWYPKNFRSFYILDPSRFLKSFLSKTAHLSFFFKVST